MVLYAQSTITVISGRQTDSKSNREQDKGRAGKNDTECRLQPRWHRSLHFKFPKSKVNTGKSWRHVCGPWHHHGNGRGAGRQRSDTGAKRTRLEVAGSNRWYSVGYDPLPNLALTNIDPAPSAHASTLYGGPASCFLFIVGREPVEGWK